MSVAFGVVLPPWCAPDQATELPERVLGEAGVDYACLPAISGPVMRFRPSAIETPHFASPGGWHFAPDARLYQSLGGKPPKPATAADPVKQLVESARQHGAAVVFRLDLRPAVQRLSLAGAAAQRNAWGQIVEEAGACVSSPVLLELARAAVQDLQRYGDADIELVDWELDRSLAPAGQRPFHWWPQFARLIETCFCPSCRGAAEPAGVDADQAARSLRVLVERLLRTEAPGPPDEVLHAYAHVRQQAVRAALERFAQRLAPRKMRMIVDHAGAPGGSADDLPPSLVPPSLLPESVQPLLRLRSSAPAAALMAEKTRLPGIAVNAWRPRFDTAPGLVRFVHEAFSRGAPDILFEDLDASPLEAVTWIKQAIRFARRG